MKPRSLAAFAGLLALTFTAPAVAALFPGPGNWYAELNKPAWNPPSWVFGPVWTLLYLLMATAAWRVWRCIGLRSRPVALYFVQLALNAAWTPVFFGARAIGTALIVLLVLFAAIVATLDAFRRVDRAAAWLLAPYLAWSGFATFLNFTLWRLNPP
jgi:tryptophan-rich sensory protein